MATYKGFFELRGAHDLLQKLEHDYQRIQQCPMDTYAAFDFFVTAEHLADWHYPGRGKKRNREILRNSSPLLQVCSHIANGAKHFVAEARHHKSVSDAKTVEGAFQEDAFQSDAFQMGCLLIELDGDAARQLGPSIQVPDLAGRVLTFWKERLTAASGAP